MWISRREWEDRSQALIKLEVKLQVAEQSHQAAMKLIEIAERDTKFYKDALKQSNQRVARLERALLDMQNALNAANATKTAAIPQVQNVQISVDEDLEEDPALVEQYRDYIRKTGSSEGLLAAEVNSGAPNV